MLVNRSNKFIFWAGEADGIDALALNRHHQQSAEVVPHTALH